MRRKASRLMPLLGKNKVPGMREENTIDVQIPDWVQSLHGHSGNWVYSEG